MKKLGIASALFFLSIAVCAQSEEPVCAQSEGSIVRAFEAVILEIQDEPLQDFGLPTHGCGFRRIALNTTFFGAIDTTSCYISENQTYVDFLRFSGVAGTRVTVTATAPDLGNMLVGLFSLEPVVATLQSGVGSGTVSFSHVLPATADYIVGIGSFIAFRTGSYSVRVSTAPSASCSPTTTSLCLNASRFRVQVAWRAGASSGNATAVPMSSDTGHFWFFNRENVELVVKVLDGRTINSRFWVFYGALSNVEYTITVTDTQRGSVRTYFNPEGQLASVADTSAFLP